MLVADFDYKLPPELIAQEPLPDRAASRLLVLERSTGELHDDRFANIGNWLRPGDLLILNDTRVMPARMFGRLATGGSIELLLVRQVDANVWEALTRPARKARPGTRITIGDASVEVLERKPDGLRIIRFDCADVARLLDQHGELALPPYIKQQCADLERYQTVYARQTGAVAAPTAGLHFTPELLARLAEQGVEMAQVTLHASLGTFRPVKTTVVEEHTMHEEEFVLSAESAVQVNRALAAGRRVVCVGTTTVRVLETQAVTTDRGVMVQAGQGLTQLYIYPGHHWRVCGALLTNFHLPRSTLLMLVAAFAGRERVLAAYQHAIAQRYRFYSFGDAMLIV